MSINITISVSETDYEALRSVSAQTHQSPEEFVTDTIVSIAHDRSAASGPLTSGRDIQQAKRDLFALMRERGHLVDPSTLPPYPGSADLPPVGTPERAQLEDELAEALGEAFAKSGKTIPELIDR